MQVKSAADFVLEAYWDFVVPISPAAIAQQLGISVVEVHAADLGSTGSAVDMKQKRILAGAETGEELRRFAVAQSLGHFCLGHEPGQGGTFDEAQISAARRFAVELLMPAVAVRALFDMRGMKDSVELRQTLGVTSEMLHERLKELGYFL